MDNLEHKILVARTAHKIEDEIREGARELGDIFKSMGIDAKAAQLLVLEVYGEAVEAIKAKVKQTQARLKEE
jgi:hypothetical protein